MATLVFTPTLQRPNFQIWKAVGPFNVKEDHSGEFSLKSRLITKISLHIKATGTTAGSGGALTLSGLPYADSDETISIGGIGSPKASSITGGAAITCAVLETAGILGSGGQFLNLTWARVATQSGWVGDDWPGWRWDRMKTEWSDGGIAANTFTFDYFNYLIYFGEA